MKTAQARGIVFNGAVSAVPKLRPIIIRTETTGDHTTLSFSDDEAVLVEIVVTPAVRKLIKSL